MKLCVNIHETNFLLQCLHHRHLDLTERANTLIKDLGSYKDERVQLVMGQIKEATRLAGKIERKMAKEEAKKASKKNGA